MNGVQYIGYYIPLDGRRIIVRKTIGDTGTRLDYTQPFETIAAFLAAWAAAAGQVFFPKTDLQANLASLVGNFGGQPTLVQMMPADKAIAQEVHLSTAGEPIPVYMTNASTLAGPAAAGLTNDQLRAAPVPVVGALTDAQLRAQALPVTMSGVATSAAQAQAQATLEATLARLGAALTVALPTGAATDATLAQVKTVLIDLRTLLTSPTLPAGAATDATLLLLKGLLADLKVLAASPVLPSGAATATAQATIATALEAMRGYLQTLAGSVVPAATRLAVFSPAASQALTLVKAGAAAVYRLHVTNAATAPRVLAFYNKATAPVAGDVPHLSVVVPAGSTQRLDFGPLGDAYPLGLGFSIGTAQGPLATLLAAALAGLGAGDVHFVLSYV